MSQWVASAAKKQGLLEDDKLHSLTTEEANKMTTWGAALWGANSRGRAIRARKLLGWECKAPSLKDEVPLTVEVEAKTIGKIPGHAKVAAGEA